VYISYSSLKKNLSETHSNISNYLEKSTLFPHYHPDPASLQIPQLSQKVVQLTCLNQDPNKANTLQLVNASLQFLFRFIFLPFQLFSSILEFENKYVKLFA
jgi:hypothetical protein